MAFKGLSVSAVLLAFSLASLLLGAPRPHHLDGASHDSLASSTQESLGSAQHESRSMHLSGRAQDPTNQQKQNEAGDAQLTGHKGDEAGAVKVAEGQAVNNLATENKKRSTADQNGRSAEKNDQLAQDGKTTATDHEAAAQGILNAKAADKSIAPKVGQPNTEEVSKNDQSMPDPKASIHDRSDGSQGKEAAENHPTAGNKLSAAEDKFAAENNPAAEHKPADTKSAPPALANNPNLQADQGAKPQNKPNAAAKGTPAPANKLPADAKAASPAPADNANPEAKATPQLAENHLATQAKSSPPAEKEQSLDPKTSALNSEAKSLHPNNTPPSLAENAMDH